MTKYTGEVQCNLIRDNSSVLGLFLINRSDITVRLNKVNNRVFNYMIESDNEFIYIGYSRKLYARLTSHKGCKTFERILLIELADKKAGRALERDLIKKYRPKYNNQFVS